MCQTETKPADGRLTLETQTCSRCGGSGRYSYCQTMNGRYGPYTCFKCLGAGVVYTKRGAAARELLRVAFSKPAEDLKPGDVVKVSCASGWHTVVRAYQQTAEDNTGHAYADGKPRYYFCVETKRTSSCGFDPRELYRVAQTAEAKAHAFPLIREYQDLLTKAGKEPKAKAKAARVAEIKSALGIG